MTTDTQTLYTECVYTLGKAQRRYEWTLKHGTSDQQLDADHNLTICKRTVKQGQLLIRLERELPLGLKEEETAILRRIYLCGDRGTTLANSQSVIQNMQIALARRLQGWGLVRMYRSGGEGWHHRFWTVTEFGQRVALSLDETS